MASGKVKQSPDWLISNDLDFDPQQLPVHSTPTSAITFIVIQSMRGA